MGTRFATVLVALFAWQVGSTAAAQSYAMEDYWVVPMNKYTSWNTVFKTTPPCTGGTQSGVQHAFWHGTFLGKTVRFQGATGNWAEDPALDPRRWDIFERGDDGSMLYWGTFRGNHSGPAPDTSVNGQLGANTTRSNAFGSPVIFMQPLMSVGTAVRGCTTDHEMSNWLRKKSNEGTWCYWLSVGSHKSEEASPADPTRLWSDVLEVTYWFGPKLPNSPPPQNEEQWQAWRAASDTSQEDYWLQNCKAPNWEGKACGTIYFKSHDPGEQSCVDYQYAASQSLGEYVQTDPSVPWYDPFMWQTYAPNGFFQDGRQTDGQDYQAPAGEAELSQAVESWMGSSAVDGNGGGSGNSGRVIPEILARLSAG